MVSADVSNLKITPDHPEVGDTIRIKGDATPNELLDVSIDFTQKENVDYGKREYKYVMDFENPQKSNFTVTAEKVEKLNVGVKLLIWWTRSVTANDNHIAQKSQNNVPAGNYHIKIDGTAAPGQSSVSLKIKASSIIHASTNGKFEYSYSTKGLPEGTYRLNVEGKNAQINLLSKREKPIDEKPDKEKPGDDPNSHKPGKEKPGDDPSSHKPGKENPRDDPRLHKPFSWYDFWK